MVTTPPCPRCRSTSVRLVMEVPPGRFLLCHSCSHRWGVSLTGRRVSRPQSAEVDPAIDPPPTAA